MERREIIGPDGKFQLVTTEDIPDPSRPNGMRRVVVGGLGAGAFRERYLKLIDGSKDSE